jgi:hypothetical protein
MFNNQDRALLKSLAREIETIHSHQHKLEKLIMTVRDEINARLDAIDAAVEANTNSTEAYATLLEAARVETASAKQALDEYKAAHPADELDDISARLDAILTRTEADTARELALANTPTDPNA